MPGDSRDCILVIDFGGQYSHLIARRIRDVGVYSELSHPDWFEESIRSLHNRGWRVMGLVLSGSPSTAYESPQHVNVARRAAMLGLPVLGICYGHQLLSLVFGGEVSNSCEEYGPVEVEILERDSILAGLGGKARVWMSHSNTVTKPPREFKVLARSRCSIAAMRHISRAIFSVQWHPEVSHSEGGLDVIRNFVYDVCGCSESWSPETMLEEVLKEASRLLESKGPVVAAVSGGVDSTVAAVIGKRIVGDRLRPVIIDTGLLREREIEEVSVALNQLGLKPDVIDISEDVLKALRGVTDPEEKRRVIGLKYFSALSEYALSVRAEFLVQGTIYPDIIESGQRPGSDRIKSHHNVALLPQDYPLKVVEPLKWLYKDEVRRLARELRVPEEIINRQPFPGPGLAIRIIGEVTREKVEIVRRADAILNDMLRGFGYREAAWQSFAVLLDCKSTGVKGDRRSYGYVVAIRVVESVDGMTAEPVDIPVGVLEEIASAIVSGVPKVTRVVYDVTTKPPATIEWE